tara:strand:- start:22559 stop:24616 length:2058 start_codon:yes stop_codon:yes gene_type:complete
MSTNKLKAAPKAILKGVRDESGGNLPVIPEQIPTHLPHVFLFTEKGPLEPQIVSGSSAQRMYGSKSFDLRSKYATHQTVLASVLNGNGNAMMVQRLKPEDANAPATIRLSLEVVSDQVPVYQRNPDGSVALDVDGKPIETGDTVAGNRARWLVTHSETGEIGNAQAQAGEMLNANDEQSTVYPIMDLQVSDFGAHGNLKGLRMFAPTLSSSQVANESAIVDQSAFLFRMQMIERPDARSQPNIIETKRGSQTVEFSLKPGSIDKNFDAELYAGDILLDAYRDLDVLPKQYGPFNGLHVYQDDIDTVLEMLYTAEQPQQPDWPTDPEEAKYLFNFVGGEDLEGNAYHTLKLEGVAGGGAVFTPNTNHYAAGGSDGTISFENLNKLVKNECEQYGDGEFPLLDTAMYPHSVFYDTGFDLDTKKAMLIPMSRRKDVVTILSTQDVLLPQNTAEQESAMATTLRAAARAFPESEVYGTSVCRAVVIGHSGELLRSPYKGLLPLTIQFADMCSSFMGAGDGIWKADRGFDTAPYNQVDMFKNVNATYKPQNVYDNDWDAGLVWVQNFDRRSLFFPAIQTVYDDSTSTLNSAINMFIVAEVEKVAERAWRQLTGNSKLTADQFIERSDDLIADMTQGRFDDRVIVVPRTEFTDIDEELGYAWSTTIELYMNNMRSVGSYTIVARRRADFAG